MKKTLKKISTLALTMAMVAGMGTAVFAADADMTGQSGVIGGFSSPDQAVTQEGTVKIYKEITAYNPDGKEVNAPAVTFNYTIGAGEAGRDIYDNASHHDPEASAHAVTKAGVGTPVITGTDDGVIELVPGKDTLSASENGTANRFELTVDFTSIDWTSDGSGAGVYRYVISETTEIDDKEAAGIKDGNGEENDQLYMDVYVDGAGEIYGYVLFTNDDDIDARESDAAAADAAGKTEGFVGSKADGEEYDDEADSTADKYYTFNLTVGKEVKNDNYNVQTRHKFPFEIALENDAVTAAVLPIVSINDGNLASQDDLSAAPIEGTWSPEIASGGKVTYVGIPTGTTVTVKEQNDVTGVMYSSVSEGADTEAERKDINTSEWSDDAEVDRNGTALTIAAGDPLEVIFTNTLLQISPTGVVLRFGPYALMLAGGLALLILAMRRRSLKAED